ncbi:hypothetical protein [uncultured Roseibium sp.]|uniref:hypothetical protein n=1 Tax=uncultured Roseibium sp. TaxID=1936171 RepID=UPI0026091960|nr:hypothetical protein [uncultured Roseibium sp.]
MSDAFRPNGTWNAKSDTEPSGMDPKEAICGRLARLRSIVSAAFVSSQRSHLAVICKTRVRAYLRRDEELEG